MTKKQRAVVEAAQRHAEEAFKGGFNELMREVARINPKGRIWPAVDAYMAHMRAIVEMRQNQRVEQKALEEDEAARAADRVARKRRPAAGSPAPAS